MSLFFETIKIENGTIRNLELHNARLNRTILKNFDILSQIDLSNFVSPPSQSKTYRCKILYTKEIEKIEFYSIIKREFEYFKLIETDIEYTYKATDRKNIDFLFKQKELCDDIIMVKKGLLTDTSIANIAFFDGSVWITPKTPILRGTYREFLLKHKLILEKDVRIKEIENYTGFAIMNAILGFYEIKNAKFTH